MSDSEKSAVAPVTQARLLQGLAGIEKYLLDRSPNVGMAQRAIAAAKPVIEAMANGYPMANNEDLDLVKANAVLQAFTQHGDFDQRCMVKTVPLPPPEGFNAERWSTEVWRPVYDSLQPWVDQGAHIGGGSDLAEYLYQRHFSFFFHDKLDVEAWRAWMRSWDKCFDRNLPLAAWCDQVLASPELEAHPEAFSYKLVLHNNLASSLRQLFLYAMAGDEPHFSKLELLAQLLPVCVPLGHDSRGCWLLPVK